MNYFLIVSIICTVGVQAVWSEEYAHYKEPDAELVKKIVKECASELDVPVYKSHELYSALYLLTYIYPGPKSDKMICMTACMERKAAEAEGHTLLSHIKKEIDFVYGSGLGSPKVTADELKSKVDNCFITEPNGCEFYKCLDIFKPPFSHFLASVAKSQFISALRSGFD